MINGLRTEQVTSETFSGTYAHFSNEQIDNAELAPFAASGNRVSLEYPVAYTGSPIKGNLALQMGTATAISNSGLAISFGKAFAAAPKVFLSTASGAQAYTDGVSAGSFILIVPAGSATTVSYFALGSGRI